jgi:endonuclease/exonuclease/phosphatase family metal-dependent hydrolase
MLSTTRTVSLADADIGRLPEQLVVGDWQDHGAARSGPGPLGRRGVLSMPVLRVMSYNIRSLRDDVGAVGRVIRHAEADVVCVQEAPRFLWWRRKCAHLARDSGLVIVSGGRDAAANMLLVRAAVKVDSARSVLFTRDRGLHQRGVALAAIGWAGGRVVVAGTHLDGYPEPRLRHVGELFAAIGAFADPVVPTVLAGDFNDDPGSEVWQALTRLGADAFVAAGAGDGFTLNVTDPTRRIDAIFAGPGVRVRSAWIVDTQDVRVASDHRPMLADLEIPVA